MNQTLSDYDLLKIRCDERQAIIDAKDEKIYKLREALIKISLLNDKDFIIDYVAFEEARKIAKQALL